MLCLIATYICSKHGQRTLNYRCELQYFTNNLFAVSLILNYVANLLTVDDKYYARITSVY